MVTVDVCGVGAIGEPVPPVKEVYHFKVLPEVNAAANEGAEAF